MTAPDGTAPALPDRATPPTGLRRWLARPRPHGAPARGQAPRTLRTNQSGAAAVEFAMVVTPFLALLVGIMGLGITFLFQQVLETGVDTTARLVLTGQAQQSKMTLATFKQQLCKNLPPFFDCDSKVQVDVQTYASFATANANLPISNTGQISWQAAFNPGKAGDIVVVRAIYPMPVLASFYGVSLSNLSTGENLIMATSVFRNEPFTS